jgi:hypothetical protein
MFIEQSAHRVRLVRLLFVVAGLLPCGVLVGLAAWRHSARHVEAVERECEALLGMPLEIDTIAHLRPGAMRLGNVRVLAAAGEPLFTLPSIDVETSATEIRIAVQRLECTPQVLAVLVDLAAAWLGEPERFAKAWVCDVGDVTWPVGRGAARSARPSGIHAEGALAGGARAVRVRREPPGGDEIRVQSLPAVATGDSSGGGIDGRRLELHAVVAEPLPAAVVGGLMGLPATVAAAIGPEAAVQGRVDAVHESGRWSGELSGSIARIDLATGTARALHRMSGEADLEIGSLLFDRSRLTRCELNLVALSGRVPQECLNAVVGVLGLRAGPAFRSLASEPMRSYDDIACRVRIDGRGIAIRAAGDRAGAVMRAQGLAILEEPVDPVPTERLAWLLSPRGREAVPASDTSAWLIERLLPAESPGMSAAAPAPERPLPPRAERPGSRGDF